MNRWKKPLRLLGVAAAILVAGAVLLGVINGLVADGAWTFGWSEYSYDDELYQMGDGSIPTKALIAISLDWIDGTVTLVACQDAYVSVTEQAEGGLTDAARMRWYVDENGVLSIKYRASSFFLSGKDKNLVLRIPEQFLEGLRVVLSTDSSNVILDDLHGCDVTVRSQTGGLALLSTSTLRNLTVETKTGKLLINGGVTEHLTLSTQKGSIQGTFTCMPAQSNLFSGKGDVVLTLPREASFSLGFASEDGEFTCAFETRQQDGRWICGTGAALLDVKTEKGNLSISK